MDKIWISSDFTKNIIITKSYIKSLKRNQQKINNKNKKIIKQY